MPICAEKGVKKEVAHFNKESNMLAITLQVHFVSKIVKYHVQWNTTTYRHRSVLGKMTYYAYMHIIQNLKQAFSGIGEN